MCKYNQKEADGVDGVSKEIKSCLIKEDIRCAEKALDASKIMGYIGIDKKDRVNRHLRKLVKSGELGECIKEINIKQGNYTINKKCKHYYLKREGLVLSNMHGNSRGSKL